MRVAVDFKVMSTEAALRGLGRYTQQQILAALDLDDSLEVVILLHGKLDPRTCLTDWLAHPRVKPVRMHADDASWPLDRLPTFQETLSYTRRLDVTLRRVDADLYHNATPFLFPFDTGVTACPVISTFYDCIPMVFPEYYLNTPEIRRHYVQCLQNVTRSERVIAISRTSRADLRLYTGYDSKRVDIAYPVVEGIFRPSLVSDRDRDELFASLNWKAPDRFALSVTGFHRSKNVKTLLLAFAEACRAGFSLPLVLVMPSEQACRQFHHNHGSPDGVQVLTDVPEADLARLYRQAEFVIQLSLYEGFGYPVAEAMASGTAVIAANAASIPEIAQGGAILVDPLDVREAAQRLVEADVNPALLKDLRRRSRERASRFTDARQLGLATVSSYRAALKNMGKPRRIFALWSSMPPLDCGIADYTAELADGLAEHHQVHIYTDGSYAPTPRGTDQVVFRDPKSYTADPSNASAIFELGGRDYQSFMFDPLRENGGTVVLHDLSMALGFYYIARAEQRLEWFEDNILAPEGAEAVAEYHKIDATSDGYELARLSDLFETHRLLRWAIGNGNRVLVHTEELRDEVRRTYPDTDVRVVRMGVVDPLPRLRHAPSAAWRTALGVGGGGLVVGSFGIVDRVKRLETVIRAFGDLCATRPDSVLLIVGRAYDQAYAAELQAEIDASPVRHRIVRRGYVPKDGFKALMHLSDVVVNLRWPTRLGVSAVLLRALAAGKPTIVSDVPEWRSIGGDAMLRVAPDAGEQATLTRYLEALAGDPARRAMMSAAARRWYLANGTIQIMAADYLAAMKASHDLSEALSA